MKLRVREAAFLRVSFQSFVDDPVLYELASKARDAKLIHARKIVELHTHIRVYRSIGQILLNCVEKRDQIQDDLVHEQPILKPGYAFRERCSGRQVPCLLLGCIAGESCL